MKLKTWLIPLIFISVPLNASYTYIGGSSVTTLLPLPSFNATGADLVLDFVAGNSTVDNTPTDSGSNSFTLIASSQNVADNTAILVYQCVKPCTVSSSYVVTQAFGYTASVVLAFSGSSGSTPLDQFTGNATNGATSLSLGTITPTEANELVLTALGVGGADSSYSTTGSFTVPFTINSVASVNYGTAIGYAIQSTATAAASTWSWTGSSTGAGVIFSMKDTPGAPPASTAIHSFR